MSKQILLVEGMADKSFYELFCRKHNFSADVSVAKPKDLGGLRNTKQGAINHLPILLKMLGDGLLDRLALVVDADQAINGGGFQRTVDQVSAVVTPFGFLPPVALPKGGLVFKHSDGLADFGLWVMPNNQLDGILEDWILQSIHGDENQLCGHAQATVGALAAPKFKPIRRVKSEVATWLAWQDRPGEGLYNTIDAGLLDETAPSYVGLETWFRSVFI